ncbi:MAG: hypothetical protein MSA90_16420 [Faecalicatena sp.]|nr:hypothetical protein [Faecalicatena sp.]MCI6467037.1 hypothetical protein [Faecalicatena sp.]MDY5617454.1 hypothetical protein [Lachnospiraceae bacterium]
MKTREECTLWIIRYIRTGTLESHIGTREETEEYAARRGKEKESEYVIN